MKEHTGDFKGFVQLSRAWYGKANLANQDRISDSVSFGFYSPEGGTSGEMQMSWVLLGGGAGSAKLECYEDAFHALGEFSDVIQRLADVDSENIQPEAFCQVLRECGFEDRTDEESPYPVQPITCPTCGSKDVTIR